MMLRRWITLLILLCVAGIAHAQTPYTPYTWAEADLALRYPATWAAPTATADTLTFTQNATTVQLSLLPPADDAFAALAGALATLDIQATGAMPGMLLEQDATVTYGRSADDGLFGMGRITTLGDGQHIVIVGRAPADQRADFRMTFDAVANTLVEGDNPPPPDVGALWLTQRFLADGETAFLDVRGLTQSGDTLYLVDEFIGIVALDVANGSVERIIPLPELDVLPVEIVAAPDGALYVADIFCACVRRWQNEAWDVVMEDFDFDFPSDIAVGADGTLYATDFADDGLVVRAGDETLTFADTLELLPEIFVGNDGLLRAVLGQQVYVSNGTTLIPLFELEVSELRHVDVKTNAQSQIVVATDDRGILIFDNAGALLAEIGMSASFDPLPGEFVFPQGVHVGANGTLYVADSDGSFGSVTAMQTGILPQRLGSAYLQPNRVVSGTLDDEEADADIWRFEGSAGETVTLTAIADRFSAGLNVAVRVLAPDGSELVFAEGSENVLLLNFDDVRIEDVALPADGMYTVLVERELGSGTYTLALAQPRDFAGDVVRGRLYDALPLQIWRYDGQAGQTITLTLTENDAMLDPVLRLIAPDGELIAENDDTPELTPGAQLADITLPADGVYEIHATRFDGEGTYELRLEIAP